MKRLRLNPTALMVISMGVFGTISVFVRRIALPSGEIAFFRALLATVLVGGFLLVTGKRPTAGKGKRTILLLLLSGFAMGINWILLFEAYKYTTVSSATLAYYFAPVIVTVLCPIFFRERLSGMQILCFTMSTVGLVLITGVGGTGENDVVGILLGLAAACFYATVVLLNKCIKDVEGIHRTFFQFLSATVTLLPYVLFTGGFHLSALDAGGWGALFTVGILHTGVTYCLYFSALRGLPGQNAAILSYIDPLVAVLISVFWLGEGITPLEIVGGVMILGFSLLNELSMRRRVPKQ